MQQLFFVYIFCTDKLGGHELPQAGSPLTGRQLFQHRLSGGDELSQRVRPYRAAPFQHRLSGVLELR